ncbi:MscS Mechanosensitive ion channel [Bradyrhizobium sp. ORS 375]|uniref:mechanosensitive ion channel family protein n=1 Tax=Bradyrhizobium sp. (strain ORS 375) TaxID=566679 RepID=UPI0002409619|nr:mechanosensitive ion channel domain-containing protein [Bradyrhizobium sp. ORS 375]CCD91618.1 MscS Mechanosensitive ion channel [Bradyrhizobium sp. ORS 375]
MDLFGVPLIGLNAENGKKLILTVILVFAALLLRRVATFAISFVLQRHHERAAFWSHQASSLSIAILLILSILSVWFDDPARLTTAAGLITAGLAFALQKVITSIAGYLVILRGRTFSVGDRITMGGVRGDVIALGFIQTTIMEMGEPPDVQSAEPAVWVRSRQFTGRIVTVTNDKIFDEPIYNYTRDFPFIWEEIRIPIGYKADRAKAEQILLAAASRHAATQARLGAEALARMHARYFVRSADVEPVVFIRLTDNWIELTLRFLADALSVRRLKDCISREILAELEANGIEIASSTFEIVGLPPVRIAPRPADHGPGRPPP